jgi:hypothetical protein
LQRTEEVSKITPKAKTPPAPRRQTALALAAARGWRQAIPSGPASSVGLGFDHCVAEFTDNAPSRDNVPHIAGFATWWIIAVVLLLILTTTGSCLTAN